MIMSLVRIAKFHEYWMKLVGISRPYVERLSAGKAMDREGYSWFALFVGFCLAGWGARGSGSMTA
jgi:hypothetical protein